MRSRYHARHAADRMLSMQKADARLDDLDLRDLRMLSFLIETRSVTRTAERLGLSQPAASRALEKLRRALDDRIIVRSGSEGVLTPRGRAISEQLPAVLGGLNLLFEPDAFDPSSVRSVVPIAATDYGATVVIGPLAAHLSTVAPGLSLDVTEFDSRTFDKLAMGSLDLALYADRDTPADFGSADLFRETYACLARPDHPAFAASVGDALLERLADAPRAVMLFPDGRRRLSDDVLTDLLGKPPRQISFQTPYFFSAPSAVAASDMVMCLPARAANLLARIHGLSVVPLPDGIGFTYRLVWHKRCQNSRQHRWLRETLVELSRNEFGVDTVAQR